MFEASFHAANRDRLKQLCDVLPIVLTGNVRMQRTADEAYSFVQDNSFWYFTGCNTPGAILVVDLDGDTIILPQQSEAERIFKGTHDIAEIQHVSGVRNVLENQAGWTWLSAVLDKQKKISVMTPAAESIETSDGQLFMNPSRKALHDSIRAANNKLEFVDIRKIVARLRAVKSTEEVEAIRAAIDVTRDMFVHLEALQDAGNEADYLMSAQHFMIDHGIEFAFYPIIAAGGNAVTLHYEANNGVIESNHGLLFDMGLRCKRYNSDITRTVFREATERQQAVYAAVQAVQVYAMSLLKPGVQLRDYEVAVMKEMTNQLHSLGLVDNNDIVAARKYYPHSTSHFLGLDVHDAGDYDQPLEENMILTVEPGIYVPEESIGVRIEDNVRITKNGVENLSASIPQKIDGLA